MAHEYLDEVELLQQQAPVRDPEKVTRAEINRILARLSALERAMVDVQARVGTEMDEGR